MRDIALETVVNHGAFYIDIKCGNRDVVSWRL